MKPSIPRQQQPRPQQQQPQPQQPSITHSLDSFSVNDELEEELSNREQLNRSFERRGAYGYAKKKVYQPSKHKTYTKVVRTESAPKKAYFFDGQRYSTLLNEGCCKPIDKCCLRGIDAGVVIEIHQLWHSYGREEKRNKLVELLSLLEREEKSSSTKVLCGRNYELKLFHHFGAYSVCPVAFYFLTSTGHELISSLFSPPEVFFALIFFAVIFFDLFVYCMALFFFFSLLSVVY